MANVGLLAPPSSVPQLRSRATACGAQAVNRCRLVGLASEPKSIVDLR